MVDVSIVTIVYNWRVHQLVKSDPLIILTLLSLVYPQYISMFDDCW